MFIKKIDKHIQENPTREKKQFYCEVCDLQMFTAAYFETHLKGRRHRENSGESDGAKKSWEGFFSKKKDNKGKNPPQISKGQKRKKVDLPGKESATKQKRVEDTSSEESVPSVRPIVSTQSDSDSFDGVVDFKDGVYTCTVCDLTIKQKRQVKPHLKSSRHQKNAKDRVGVDDERASGTGSLEEITFTRPTDTSTSKAGSHFLVEIHRPCKYKISKHLFHFTYTCSLCLVSCRSLGVHRRHLSSRAHKEMARVAKNKRRRMRKPVAGGDLTHGEVMQKIFERRPDLKWKSRLSLQRRRLEKKQSFLEKVAICNEFGSDIFKNSHSHLYVQTKNKMTFKQFKIKFFKLFNVRINNVLRLLNFRECIRYITKEDRMALLINIPLKFTLTVYRVHRYYRECGSPKVHWGDYIPSLTAACERKVFEDVVAQEASLAESSVIADRVENLELTQWQNELLGHMPEVKGNNRCVIWVADVIGGAGESMMCQWLLEGKEFGKGILFQDFDYKNNTYLFDCESLVLSDVPRSSQPDNLRLIEDLKNGYLISSKYEVRRKVFPSPVVVVFSNSFPDKMSLSLDRWKVLEIRGGVEGYLVCHPEFNNSLL